MELKKKIRKIAEGARQAARELVSLKTRVKNSILKEMAGTLVKSKTRIKKANARDLKEAEKKGLSGALDHVLRRCRSRRRMARRPGPAEAGRTVPDDDSRGEHNTNTSAARQRSAIFSLGTS